MGLRYHVERTIEAPIEKVWGLLTDGSGYTSWNPTVISLGGEIRQGQTIDLVSTVNPKRTFTLTVEELSEPNRMVWADGMPLGLFTGTRTYLLNRQGEATTFSMTEEYAGLLAPLITRAIPDLSESFVQIADGLKAAAEA